MKKLVDGLILYHGSYCEIQKPDLKKCSKRKDFGQGFYLTTSKEQAISFLNTSITKAIANGDIDEKQEFGYVSSFVVNMSNKILINSFEEADENWLHCIAAHRKRKMFLEIEAEMKKFDVIIGKIADDTTNTVLAAYIAGVYGKVGDKTADEFCINQLLPEKLKDQFCFKTEKAISCLVFKEAEKIWLNK